MAGGAPATRATVVHDYDAVDSRDAAGPQQRRWSGAGNTGDSSRVTRCSDSGVGG